MDKGEMIAEFYSLRAGLSLIAQEKDKLDAEIDAAEKRKATETEKARFVADTKIEKSAEAVRRAEERKARCERQSESQTNQADLSSKKEKALSEYCEKERLLAEARESASTENKEKIKVENKRRKRIILLKIIRCLLYMAIPIVAIMNVYLFNSNSYVFISLFIMLLGLTILTSVKTGLSKILIIGGNIIPITCHCVLIIFSFLENILICKIMCFANLASAILFSIALISNIRNSLGCYNIMSAAEKCERAAKELHELERETEIAKQKLATARRDFDNAYQAQATLDNAVYQAKYELEQAENSHGAFVRNAESEYASTCAEINEQYETTCAAAKAVHSEIGSAIYDLLVKQYGKLLDARDWQIVDLVIWQLETGRADTLKEALQLADRETQTDRIVASINSAAMYISSSIRDGLYSLQTRLDDNFRALAYGFATGASLISERLDKLSASVAASARALSEQIDFNAQASADLYERQIDGLLAANSNIEQLVSQTTLNTALLEKSNQSSKTLVAAVEKLRRA